VKRKLYRDLYEVRTERDPDTGRERKRAVYRGEFYCLIMDPGEKRKRSAGLALLILASILLYLTCGFLNLPSSRSFYVLPFYLCLLFPLFYAAMAAFRLVWLPQAFTRIQKAECLDSLPHSCVGLMVLSGLYIAGSILFLTLDGANSRFQEELQGIACIAGVGFLAGLIRRGIARLSVSACTPKP